MRTVSLFVGGALTLVLAWTLLPPSALSDDAAGAASAAPTKPPRLKPDLIALRAADLHVAYDNKGRRKLRFESGLGNIGDGPVEVRPNRARKCPPGKHNASQVFYRDENRNGRYNPKRDTSTAHRSAGCMVFHRFHDHWHFEAASRYTLFKARKPDVSKVARRKMSFCLRDSRRVPKVFGTFPYDESYGACSRYSPQGISVGWVDVYQSFLAGQAVKFPRRMGDGLYCLHTKVDPANHLVETNDRNNTSLRAFVVRGDRVSYRDVKRCRGLL
jgi:hypothetical protein